MTRSRELSTRPRRERSEADTEATNADPPVEAIAAIEARARSEQAEATRSDKAQQLWREMAAGRLAIVERFDRDGRRFLLARRCPPGTARRTALTDIEWRVAGYASMGYASKTIAFNLGLGWSTVAERLRSAMNKLGVSSRAELIQLFNPRWQ